MEKVNNYSRIKNNLEIIKKLYQAGYVSSTALLHCKLFDDFKKVKHPEIMMRYQKVADDNGVSLSTVIKAIKRMKQ